MSRSPASPRVLQLYSPRCPSPLGLPPLAPHMAFQDAVSYSAFPKTPERYYIQHSEGLTPGSGSAGRHRFPPDHRPRAGATQRARALPPAPLSLDTQHHPAAIPLSSSTVRNRGGGGGASSLGQTVQPDAAQEMRVPSSPTPSSTSSLSLYSSESAKKSFPNGVNQDQQEEREDKRKGGFCMCFSAFIPLSQILHAYRYFLSFFFSNL